MDYAKDNTKEKIEKARAALDPNARAAIDSVNWKDEIVRMRETKKLSFSQIEALGVATELILAGLLTPPEYRQKLKTDMGLRDEDTTKLVEEMNEIVFKKIKENLIARLGSVRTTTKIETLHPEITAEDTAVLESNGIDIQKEDDTKENAVDNVEAQKEIIEGIENPDQIKKPTPIIEKKLTTHFQVPIVKTEYKEIESKKEEKVAPAPVAKPTLPTIDPYKEPIE